MPKFALIIRNVLYRLVKECICVISKTRFWRKGLTFEDLLYLYGAKFRCERSSICDLVKKVADVEAETTDRDALILWITLKEIFKQRMLIVQIFLYSNECKYRKENVPLRFMQFSKLFFLLLMKFDFI